MRVLTVSLLVALAGATLAQGAVLDISNGQPGYATDVKEAWVRGYGGGTNRDQQNTRQPDAAASSTGAWYRMYSTDAPGSRSGGASYLVGFDVSDIPTNNIVNSATLTLTYRRNQGTDVTGRKLAKLAAGSSWSEGPNVHEPNATSGGVTWNNRITHPTTATPWSTAGALGFGDGDGGGTNPLDQSGAHMTFDTIGGTTGSYQQKTFDVTAWVQDWVTNPANNQGMVTWGGTNGGIDAFWAMVGTDDSAAPSFRPSLVIDYMVPEPTSLLLVGAGMFAFMRRRRMA